ncbi:MULTISPECIES: Crp/Fnr family transcriptional regulator [Myroides]|uniref:Cyclic nucleotide-binding domain-containing protein n=1 Tax=Myroides albus TaxID=2562892 RepID=A0A6I3LMI5_9FLAO|nr:MULTISPECIES: Crp/Fnr family transcriptional regulator [Myroides]MTG97801.1 cyclic nucleotide-binding domain-containing protein [Myroides albus]MVX37160.1 cyclic nucleotide-binding domain-containing protein [Myroides sp. LoEW2-1]UVD79758.1 Crp/Fnr family transcriptional regulator [Myroides albus]
MKSTEIGQELLHELQDKVKYRKFKKGDEILSLGETCDFVGFVNKGALRMYYIEENGKEVSFSFYLQNDVFTNYEGILTGKPSNLIITALNDVEVSIIYKKELLRYYETSLKAQRIGRIMAEAIFLQAKKRIDFLLFLNPEQRYLQLVSDTPKIFEQVPQKYIASYLGITAQSLSRIRKRITQERLT